MPTITFGNKDNPTDLGESSLRGLREFLPDYSLLVKQLPLVGPLFPVSLPRAGSTVMLASILRLGLHVSQGIPGYAKRHAAIKAHYQQKIGSWLQTMKLSTFGDPVCWEKYYGLNIVFLPAFNLIRMEPDPAQRAALQQQVLEARLWSYVKDHKNVFFSYLYAAHQPPGPATQAVIAQANAQLALFAAPPNVERPIDLSGKYPAHPTCKGLTQTAVDVSDRWADYFTWQKHPFYMSRSGDPTEVWPGVDYLLPYWIGRAYNFLGDDATGTCLRWLPDGP